MQRFDFDWYSPTRLVDSSIKYDFPGDRFIPNRSLMDLSHAQTLMTSKAPEKKKDNAGSPEKSKFNDEYRKRVQENLDLDSEGRPFRMLVFRGSPVSSRKSLRQIDELLQQERLNARTNTKPMRPLPKSAHRILDAPGLIDNYYMNLIDWGNNNVLAVALRSSLYMWNAHHNKVQKLMDANRSNGDDDYPTSVAWSESAKTVAVGLSSSKVQLWDAEKCQLVRSLEGHQLRVGCLAWKGQSLTSGSQDKSIIHHDVRSRNSLTSRLKAHADEVCGLKWSSRGNQLASGGNDNIIHIWEASNMHSSKPLQKFADHRAAVKALAWSPHQYDVLASGGGTKDRCIKIWNSQNGKCLSSTDTNSQICGLEWNRYEKEILSGHGYNQNSLCLWKYPSMTKMAELKGHHTARIINICQSPDGLTVVSAVADETLRFWKIFERPKPTTEADTESLLSLKRYQIR